jgi:hypothetical protein
MRKELCLKDRQEYLDRYDRFTVERCRRIDRSYNDDIDQKALKDKKISKKQAKQINKWAHDMQLYYEKGERYANRDKTVQEWMDADRKKDELYESAEPPENVRCLTCRNRLTPIFKDLMSSLDKEDRILFMFECPNKCLPRRAFYADGEEWRSKPDLCPHCDKPLSVTMKDDGKVSTTTYSCAKCKYKRSEDYIWRHKEEGYDEDFATDRDKYCLTEEEGKEYLDGKWSLEGLSKITKEFQEKENARQERLKETPEGFAVEGYGGSSCNLCGQYNQDGDFWYDKWGIKCLVCQRAIDKKEIPGSLMKFTDSWYSNFDIQNRFNLKSPTIQKWIRQGVLKARTISHYGKGTWAQVFLIKDNEDFLPPKKFTNSRSYSFVKDGKIWNTSAEWYKYADLRKKVEKYKIMNYIKVVEVEKEKEKQDD